MHSCRKLTRRRNQRGVVIPIVALCLVALTFIMAIVVDLGNGRQKRRQVQNAVDASALAATSVYDGTAGTKIAAKQLGLKFLIANHLPVPTVADANDIYSCTGSSECTLTFTFSAVSGRPCVEVKITDLKVGTFFAQVFGPDRLYVGARANGCKNQGVPSTSVPAAFTGGEYCNGVGKAFVSSGNGIRFEGNIHSNADVKDSGNSNVATGGKTRVGAVVQNNGLWTPSTVISAMAWPINPVLVTATMYDSSGTRGLLAAGGWHNQASSFDLSGNVPAGIYYATGSSGIKLTDVNVVPKTVSGVTKTGATFVARSGKIEVAGNNSDLIPFQSEPDRIVLFGGWQEKTGGDRCDSETVIINGNCNHFDGVVFVPEGKFRISGEGNGHDWTAGSGQCSSGIHHPTYSGGVVAYAVELSGNYSLLRGGWGGASTPDQVFLDS